MTARDHQRLEHVHPQLATAVAGILADMEVDGHLMFVVMGARTAEEQARLYAQGRTVPGKIVTMKDGIRHKSNHQLKIDGFGHAVDCAFAGVPDPFDDSLPWEAYGLKAEARGLTWGGRWKMHDCPHVELA